MIDGIAEILFVAIVAVLMVFPCKFGNHCWNEPGGHCEDCGKCDEFFGKHWACRNLKERP